jgi:uncharacterized coiled-coil DUF342 family protein
MNVSELKVTLDTSELSAALDRAGEKIDALIEKAHELRRLQPELKDAVDAVLDGIARITARTEE